MCLHSVSQIISGSLAIIYFGFSGIVISVHCIKLTIVFIHSFRGEGAAIPRQGRLQPFLLAESDIINTDDDSSIGVSQIIENTQETSEEFPHIFHSTPLVCII